MTESYYFQYWIAFPRIHSIVILFLLNATSKYNGLNMYDERERESKQARDRVVKPLPTAIKK